MPSLELHPTLYAICSVEGNAIELYPANFSMELLALAVFFARRLPDRIHYRIVRCNTRGLVRSDPVADPRILAKLYEQNSFSYNDEVDNFKLPEVRRRPRMVRSGIVRDGKAQNSCLMGWCTGEPPIESMPLKYPANGGF